MRRKEPMRPEAKCGHCGPRPISFMVYLSGGVQGGGTEFTRLTRPGLFAPGLIVQPTSGQALLWQNTKSSDPFAREVMTTHEAMVVRRGVKFISTTWFYTTPFRRTERGREKPHFRCCRQILKDVS